MAEISTSKFQHWESSGTLVLSYTLNLHGFVVLPFSFYGQSTAIQTFPDGKRSSFFTPLVVAVPQCVTLL